jgi:hypothetical protein
MSRLLLRPCTLAATLAAATLLSCSAEVDDNPLDQSLVPLITRTEAPATCAAAGGGATVVLDDVGTQVVTNVPNLPPVNRLDLRGSVTGLGAGDNVVVALLSDDAECQLFGAATATLGAGGAFTAQLDIADRTLFRVVAIATSATAAQVGCDTANGCLSVSAGSISGVSEALRIELPI